jgi:hypothetical protein
MSGAIIPLKKPPADSGDGIDEESEEEDHDRSSRGGSKSTWTNYSTKGVRNASKRDDSDSDFDL